jgi:hypothetical protein
MAKLTEDRASLPDGGIDVLAEVELASCGMKLPPW